MNIVRLKLILFTIAAAAMALGATMAATSPAGAQEPAARVAYDDLNLDSAAGVAKLDGRIRAAAEQLCITNGVETLQTRLAILACRDKAIASAQPQVRRAVEHFAAARGGAAIAVTLD